MGSIPGESDSTAAGFLNLLDDAARKAALKFDLPWDLALLRQQGEQGIQEAFARRRENPGVSPEQFASKYVRKQVTAEGKIIRVQRDALGEKYPQPSDQRIAEALETFSAQEWRGFIDGFGRSDLDALRMHLDANKGDLLQTPDHTKYRRILEAAVTRSMIMHLSWAAKKRRKFVSYLDAFYAVYWRESARRENRRGVTRPRGTRLMETVSLESIAKALSRGGHRITPKQVAGMFRRWKETPLESFEGDPSDYWLIITDALAYNRYRRGLSRRQK
jgi:hypothetical protein